MTRRALSLPSVLISIAVRPVGDGVDNCHRTLVDSEYDAGRLRVTAVEVTVARRRDASLSDFTAPLSPMTRMPPYAS